MIIKGITRRANKVGDWLLKLEQQSDPAEEACRNGTVCARTWVQEHLVGPFLASVREMQVTVALVPAARGIG